MSDWKRFYKLQTWQDCRESYAKKAHYLCELCLQEGRHTPGEIVHHIVPLTANNVNDPSISLSFDNLQLLCREHHAQVHKKNILRYRVDELGRVIIK